MTTSEKSDNTFSHKLNTINGAFLFSTVILFGFMLIAATSFIFNVYDSPNYTLCFSAFYISSCCFLIRLNHVAGGKSLLASFLIMFLGFALFHLVILSNNILSLHNFVFPLGLTLFTALFGFAGLGLGALSAKRCVTERSRNILSKIVFGVVVAAFISPPVFWGVAGWLTRLSAHNVGAASLSAQASDLKETQVIATLESPIIQGENLIYCATMQVAWNALCNLAGQDVQFDPTVDLADSLNKKAVDDSHLDPATYIAFAGIAGSGIVKDIQDALHNKFHGAATPELVINHESFPNGTVVAYAYLFANLPFKWRFDRTGSFDFAGRNVSCFGIDPMYGGWRKNERQAEHVRIYDAVDKDNFIIELLTARESHHLYLAKVSPEETLELTVKAVMQRIQDAEPEMLKEYQDIKVPIFDFDIVKDYDELLGNPIDVKDPRLSSQTLTLARQKIRFRLDERGAVLKSESVVASGITDDFIFDKPFLLMLLYETSAMPYFAMWVDNAELMLPGGAASVSKSDE